MMLIETPLAVVGDANARQMTPAQQFFSRIYYWAIRQRRRFPYLVWWNDELDITVNFSRASLGEPFNEDLAAIEQRLSHMGVGFDRGAGFGGRDWEWDWSLKGPISLRFRGRSKHPETRAERPRPQLVEENASA